MTCSRLFILGALLAIAPPVTAQPAAPAAAPAAKAPAQKGAKAKTPAQAAPSQGAAAQGAATQGAPAGAGKATQRTGKTKAGAAPAPAAPVEAKYPAGLPEPKVRQVRNQVELAGAERRAAKQDDSILPGQKVSTQAQSSSEVTYADGTRLLVGENSELSLYGVAPVTPPGKKPRPFKPGTTTLLRGELVLIVPAPPPVAAPPPAVKGKKVVKKAPALKAAVTATVATPAGRVVASPGTEVRVSVDPNGITRVAVYSGQAQLIGKGKPIVLAAGNGSRIDSPKVAPKPAQPLPPAPVLAGVQQLTYSGGGAANVRGTYAPAPGSTPPVAWHLQVARDSSFDNLVSDIQVAGTESRLLPKRLEPGEYYARVSALNAEGAEGPFTAPARVRVARVSIIPGSEGKRAAVAVEGKDLYCALDGAPLSPVLEPLQLTPARDHHLRCAVVSDNPKPDELFDHKIKAAQSGPLVARIEPGAVTFTPADPKLQTAATGQRQVTLVLSDASGAPLSNAAVRVEGVGGAQVTPAREGQTPGSYVTTVTWSAGQSGQGLHYTINDVETYDGKLPDALPPSPAEAEKAAEVSEPSSAKRFALELSLFPSAGIDTSRLAFNVGGGLEVGGRIRLPYGALAFALRPQYEYYPAAPGVSHVVAAGLPITYRIRRNVDADIVPYIGILPQFIADYSFLAKDGVQVTDGQWRTAFGLGGLVGTEFRVKHGGVFVEAGYRYVLLRTVPDYLPSLNSLFVNAGYRITF